MSVKLAKNGTWLAQFRCKDKFGNEVHKCKRGFATAEEAQAWEDELIASAGRRHGDDFRRVLQSVRSRSTPQAARAHLAAEGVRDQVEGAAFLRKQEDGRDTRHRHRPLAKRPHGARRKRRQALQHHVPAHAQQPAHRHPGPRGEVLRAESQSRDEACSTKLQHCRETQREAMCS